MWVTFHGVRGSFPTSSPANRRYGGNTASLSLHMQGEAPILFDFGTGVVHVDHNRHRRPGRPFRASAFVTHLHLDHVQGFPFFEPVHQAGTGLDVYGPRQDSGTLREAFAALVRPPYFPLPLDEFLADLRFHEVASDELSIGRAAVKVRPVPHRGPSVGYRVEWAGATLAYVSDHQAPPGLDHVADGVLELCDGVDLLIHEAQYTDAEFAAKGDWGHCTVDYAVRVARESGARRLCMFHHDPWRSDDDLDALVEGARRLIAGGPTTEVMAAAEGTTLEVAAAVAGR